jgi:hypothetical protein
MASLLSIEEIQSDDNKQSSQDNFRAYYIKSTAKTTIEEEPTTCDKPSEAIKKIVEYILARKEKNKNMIVDVVVQIHGYNTGEGYKEDYKKARAEIEKVQKADNSPDHTVIFLGYSWPSEKFILSNPLLIVKAFGALPGWLNACSLLGILWVVANSWPTSRSLILDKLNTMGHDSLQLFADIQSSKIIQQFSWEQLTGIFLLISKWILFLGAGLTTLVMISSIILILLRVTVYFRDSYRATHYGVPDLVQFFRTFEYLIKQQDTKKLYGKNTIRLSFVGHSMGGFVTTNLIRVLSDVFDQPSSAGSSSIDDPALAIIDGRRMISKKESKRSNVGDCFTLERLVLVSPDIPVNAILSGRSNFLSSSLSRFRESYLFSNEGDMVLLLLSTVANYISFPSTTPQMGYKLGNLGVNKNDGFRNYTMSRFAHLDDQMMSEKSFAQRDNADLSPKQPTAKSAPQTSSYAGHHNQTGNVLSDIIIGIDHKNLSKVSNCEPFVAQEFTYFDCTDYLRYEITASPIKESEIIGYSSMSADDREQSRQIRSEQKRSKKIAKYRSLNLLNYAALVLNLSKTHGGYFDFLETQNAIYTIACKGFDYFNSTDVGTKMLAGHYGIKVLKADNSPKQNP